MTIYQILPVFDNPLFSGLYLEDKEDKFWFCPKDWNHPPFWNWESPRLISEWPDPPPPAEGHVRSFNDYPGINLGTPAFSQRSVDYLRDLLEPNGELLPVRHSIGIFYVYNCTRLVNCLDLDKSEYSKFKDGQVHGIRRYAFIPEKVIDLTFFRLRPEPLHLYCTQVVLERVKKHGLIGFVFVPVWSEEKNITDYLSERRKAQRKAQTIKPAEGPPVPVKSNTVVIRLYTEKKKAKKAEMAATELIMDDIEAKLYDPNKGEQDYFGNIEGHDVVDHEIRIFMSAPDCNRLVEHLRPYLKKLPWKGRYQVLKRFGEYVDIEAREEYVRL